MNYLDIYVLQSVPAANINRDDTGAPKTVVYGGVTRSRVSSQAWKRAMRNDFREQGIETGFRTKKVLELLTNELIRQKELDSDSALKIAQSILDAAKIKYDKENLTKALLMISPGQIRKLVEYALTNEKLDSKEIKEVFDNNNSIDLALFGRMVADNPELTVEATSQVAHAISTHEIEPEFDYFTALDDLQNKENAGAAMLGDLEYNSSTLYRYANVNIRELIDDLGKEDAIKGAKEFIKSFVKSMPTGKQNTFANKTVPGYVMVVLRKDTPVNLVSAFEEPIRSKNGYLKESIRKLNDEYVNTMRFVEEPVASLVLSKDAIELKESQIDSKNLGDLLKEVVMLLEEGDKNESINN